MRRRCGESSGLAWVLAGLLVTVTGACADLLAGAGAGFRAGRIYVPFDGGEVVGYDLDLTEQSRVRVDGIGSVSGCTFNAAGRLVILCRRLDDLRLVEIDAGGRITREHGTGRGTLLRGSYVAFDPIRSVYAFANDDRLDVLDEDLALLSSTASIFRRASGVAFGADGLVYAADQSDPVIRRFEISGLTAGSFRYNAPIPSGMSRAADGFLFIASFGDGAVDRVATSNGASTRVISPLGRGSVSDVDALPAGRLVTIGTGGPLRIFEPSGALRAVRTLEGSAESVAYLPCDTDPEAPDCDGDGIPDSCDEPADDCNRNGVPDACDLADGTSSDCDDEGTPDECQRGDCDRDGVLDVCAIRGGTVEDCNANGVPDLCEPTRFALAPPVEVGDVSQTWLVAVDFDGDGDLDAVTLRSRGGRPYLWRNDAGSLQPGTQLFDVGLDVLAVADLDGDGTPDLVGGARTRNDLTVLFGDGTDFVELAIPTRGTAASIITPDIDGDGDLDIVVAALNSCECVSVILNEGGRVFREELRLDAGDNVSDVVAVDLDQDGDLDLAAANFNGQVVTVIRNAGAEDGEWRGFIDSDQIPFAGNQTRILAGDYDGDGGVDLVVLHSNPSGVSILLGRGGSFESPELLANDLGEEPPSMASADLDHDGSLDLAIATGERLVVLLNDGGARFRRVVDLERLAAFVGLGPVNEERLDLLLAGRGVTTLENLTVTADCDDDGVLDDCRIAEEPRLDLDENGVLDACESGAQLPGDCNQDARVDVSDAICIATALFGGSMPMPCGEGGATERGNVALVDWDASGSVSIADAAALLTFVFRGGPPSPLTAAEDPLSRCVLVPACVSNPRCG